jgi:methionine aminopeptidase, type I (EC 3.4.11.18)
MMCKIYFLYFRVKLDVSSIHSIFVHLIAKKNRLIHYKTNEEIEIMRRCNQLVSAALAEIASLIKPGISPLEIDKVAETFILDHHAKPAFKGYHGFPAACCISVNEEVVHGIPNDVSLEEGDIVSVDIGVQWQGFIGDSAYTFGLAGITDAVKKLMKVTKEALYLGIEQAIVGNRVGDISWAIQEHTEKKHGYGVVRALTGHGVGKNLHEKPDVPNYGKKGIGTKLLDGLTIAIEPMINLGTSKVYCADDDWTIVTDDGQYSAHYEHSIVVRKGKADILSSFDQIEKNEAANINLCFPYV